MINISEDNIFYAFKLFLIYIIVTVILMLVAGCDSQDYSAIAGRWEGSDSQGGKLRFVFGANRTVLATRELDGEKLGTIDGSYTLSGNRISGKLTDVTFSGTLTENKIQGEWMAVGYFMMDNEESAAKKFELTRIGE